MQNTPFQLDQRSVLQLQQFVLELAGQIPFQATEQKWKDYLLNDITFRLVSLLSFNPDTPENDPESWKNFLVETREYLAKFHSVDPFWEKLYEDFDDQIKKSKLNSSIDRELEKNIRNFQHSFKANFFHYYLESLSRRSDHSPDAGLLLAFIDLFAQHLIPELNSLPGSLTAFYYERIDKKRLPPLADMAHVYFEPVKFGEKKLISKGLPLYAGRDKKNENIGFKTLDDVSLSQSRIKKLYTLFFTKPNSRDTKPNSTNTKGYPEYTGPQGIFLQECYFEEQDKSFETFGQNIKIYEKVEKKDPRNAEFGLAISSKLLFLKKGKREITIKLDVEDQLEKAFKELGENSGIEDSSNWEKLKTIFSKHLSYDITSERGWEPLGDPEITLEDNTFEVKFKLGEDFKSIDVFSAFDSNPAIRFRLQSKKKDSPHSEIELYSFFKMFRIRVTELRVRVEGLKDLTCHNDLGILNTNQPFQPFTSTPVKNSTFIVGHAEAFQKPLKQLELKLTWNLPDNFGEYFKGYDSEIIEKDNYKINNEIGLFPEGDLIKITEFDQKPPEEWQEILPDYSKDCQWGYLKLQLTAPNHPFGVGLYQKKLIQNNNINPPLTPEIIDIRLNYTASSTSDFQLYHIHPIGNGKEEAPKDKQTEWVTKLYEHADGSPYQGSLFIGVEKLTPGLLSIYFELVGSSLIPSNSESQAEPPAFFLVSNNKFEPLPKIADTTEGFEQSGIVQLNIPSRLIENNRTTILPEGFSWIVVTVKENAESFGRTNSIHLHGARAVRTTSIPQFEQEQAVVAAGTITRTLNDEPAIKKVWQPYPSFGGRVLEDPSFFSNRVAAELRHRVRPTKPEDIEGIIYNAFPQVYFCRASMNNNVLKVLVVPPQNKDMPHHRPSFPITFLQKIKKFIKDLVPPFLTVVVDNPHYAILQAHLYLETKPINANINPKQIEYQLKKDLIHRYLNPWQSACLDFGKGPDFNKLKNAIEVDYNLVLKDWRSYFYFIGNNKLIYKGGIKDYGKKYLTMTLDSNLNLSYDNHKIIINDKKNWDSNKGEGLLGFASGVPDNFIDWKKYIID